MNYFPLLNGVCFLEYHNEPCFLKRYVSSHTTFEDQEKNLLILAQYKNEQNQRNMLVWEISFQEKKKTKFLESTNLWYTRYIDTYKKQIQFQGFKFKVIQTEAVLIPTCS